MTEAGQRARARCRKHEGCKLEGYTDSLGKWNVGDYGLLANRARQRKLAECRRALGTPLPPASQQDAQVIAYRDRYTPPRRGLTEV
ncbi:MAG: hypothetical protein F4X11_25810 [Acidobacteria bacterium]|nr:hypothetical protein [Chloroflexota bacterium]MYN68393.1 hypothetical protein [Acidobacteriota bacterium]